MTTWFRCLCRSSVVAGATILALASAGCTSLVERVASHLAEKDVKALDQEFHVFEADLALFRDCLKRRGGSCEGGEATPVPHSSQDAAARKVVAVTAVASAVLAESVDELPPGHPARGALGVLRHPVFGRAAALHDHLRGHQSGEVAGFSVERGTGEHGGPQSTATMRLGVQEVEHFHRGLLSSLDNDGWRSLDGHCAQRLARHGDAPGREALENECRRIAFIRGYLDAYVRHGEFVEVDVDLAGAVDAVKGAGGEIEGKIDGLLAELGRVKSSIASAEKSELERIGGDAKAVASGIDALVRQVETSLERRYGAAAREIFNALSGLTAEAETEAGKLIAAAGGAAGQEIRRAVAQLDDVLGEVRGELVKLRDRVAKLDGEVVKAIVDEGDRANATLSNVFQLSSVGFVSRDHTFQARLPTLAVRLDPTARQLVTVTDEDAQPPEAVLSSRSAFGELGVATDTSGVGTGASIGAEVVRVFLEAVFDAHEGLPAVAPANPSASRPTGLGLGAYSLPLFSTPMRHVDSSDLTRMTHTNDAVAAKTRVIVGRIIEGIGPFSLNNESLEDLIVEIITTSVRKATAKATWCWYACNLDADLSTLEGGARKVADDAASDARARIRAEAEHVKLRLRLGK